MLDLCVCFFVVLLVLEENEISIACLFVALS